MDRKEFGINLPQFHPDDSGQLFSVGDFAEKAESLGFDSVWTLDRVFHGVPFLEPLSMLAFVASRTRRIKLGTAVLMTPLRIPSILAKTAATIDFLSGGRLILGIALGGQADEYAASGTPMNERVARFVEGIKIMRMLWNEDNVNFQGRFWKLNNVSIHPKPSQRGGIPLWIGGSQVGSGVKEAVVKRAARHGDGWLGAGSSTLTAFEDAYRKFILFAKELGRESSRLTGAKRVYVHVDSDVERARKILDSTLSAFYGKRFNVEELCVYGSESSCSQQLARYVEAGARTIILHPVADQLHQAEVLAKDVVPGLR